MCAGKIILDHADGLHLLCRVAVSQLAADDRLKNFADGLLARAISFLIARHSDDQTLAAALHHSDPAVIPLLVSMLALDAELTAVVNQKKRVLPLPGFLSYRPQLPMSRFPLDTLRLPPLNPDGHYYLSTANGLSAAVRLDLHPRLKIAGHVRIALGSATRQPTRLLAAEHRLNRQPLTETHIDNALAAVHTDLDAPLTPAEQTTLTEILCTILPSA
jgi:CO/xanthine dehydrogenase FAD-binding subunit